MRLFALGKENTEKGKIRDFFRTGWENFVSKGGWPVPKNRIIPIFIPHAGCPNACVFCNQRKIAGTLAPPTPEEVRRQIAQGLGKSGGPCEVAFYGGSFTAIPEGMQNAYLAAAGGFLHRLSGIRLSTRPDAMDDAIALRLKGFGVTTVELGVQSMDDRVLALAKRGHSAHDTEKAAEGVKKNGIKLILQIMPGLPGDTPAGAVKTAETVGDLRPDGVRVYPVVVVEGTELADMWRRGEYRPMTLDEAAEVCAQIAEILAAQGIPVIRMGLNPSEELSGGGALAGAYHPAFGELVKSRILLKKVGRMLENAGFSGTKGDKNGSDFSKKGSEISKKGTEFSPKMSEKNGNKAFQTAGESAGAGVGGSGRNEIFQTAGESANIDLHGGVLKLRAHPRTVSALIGDKGSNRQRMKQVFNASKVIIIPDESIFEGEIAPG